MMIMSSMVSERSAATFVHHYQANCHTPVAKLTTKLKIARWPRCMHTDRPSYQMQFANVKPKTSDTRPTNGGPGSTNDELTATTISPAATKRLFFNAENDASVERAFKGMQKAIVAAPKPEVRPEEKPIDPFAHLEEGRKEREQARFEAAVSSDPSQQLVHGPSVTETTVERLEDLPALVRQAAQAAALKGLKARGLVKRG